MLKRTALLLLSAILILAVVLTSCKGNGIAESETDEIGSAPLSEERVITMLPSQDVRVVSINLAYNRDNMEARGEYMMPLLLSYEPDSIGTQENGGYTDWLMYFEQKLPNYDRVGLVSTGEPEERNPKLLLFGDAFGFLLFFESEL